MEGPRFVIAIVLSIAVVILVNVLFPPGPPPPRTGPDTVGTTIDSVAAPPAIPAERAPAEAAPAPAETVATAVPADPRTPLGADTTARDTVWVETDVARYGIATRGAAVVSVELLEFASYTRDGPVQLTEPRNGALLSFSVRLGDRVFPLDAVPFDPSTSPGDTVRPEHDPLVLRMGATVRGAPVEIRYTFAPGGYLVDVAGDVGAIAGNDATLLLGLGPRLAVNEADSAEDLRALGYVVNSRREGIEGVALQKVGTDRVEEGPLTWVALKNKYFLVAALPPQGSDAAFGGVIVEGGAAGATSIRTTMPLDRDGGFQLRLFFGPQEFGRLSAIGAGLEDVNPYGWRVFRPIIRPLAHVIAWLLEGLHDVLNLGYGWVLILFGFVMRALMWPLNAKAMRSQLKTMELQPRIKEIQAKYKEKPELLQKEMVKLYKEEGFNPLGGCLPMLIPWPVLITLFFVFQNTIEFRGVDFLWLPDLSRPDPVYVLPVVLGLSLFVTQWMNLRAAPQDNPQMKMMMWFMPIIMVVIFLNFASGLNLYYAASNVAGIPQQVQIIRERGRARERLEAKKETAEREARQDQPQPRKRKKKRK
ncbi:MAG TPA: membrane protein insertase YidC [Longimicrobiales bacterium]|nr:membrane protein insertase YidC [Longimicrobiales bacterium]